MSGVYVYINISNNSKTVTIYIHTHSISMKGCHWYHCLKPLTIPLFLMGISFLIYAHFFRNTTLA